MSYYEVFRVWFFQIICKSFLSRRDFLSKVCTYSCLEIIEIFCYFNWIRDSIIISNYGRYITPDLLFHVYLAISFWNLFYSVQNDVDSKFVDFALLIQLFNSCIFCMTHA